LVLDAFVLLNNPFFQEKAKKRQGQDNLPIAKNNLLPIKAPSKSHIENELLIFIVTL